MNWLLRKLPLLALLVAIAAAVLALYSTITVMGAMAWHSSPWGAVWLFCTLVYRLGGIGLAYGLFLRLLVLCDDVAALRRAKAGTSPAVD